MDLEQPHSQIALRSAGRPDSNRSSGRLWAPLRGVGSAVMGVLSPRYPVVGRWKYTNDTFPFTHYIRAKASRGAALHLTGTLGRAAAHGRDLRRLAPIANVRELACGIDAHADRDGPASGAASRSEWACRHAAGNLLSCRLTYPRPPARREDATPRRPDWQGHDGSSHVDRDGSAGLGGPTSSRPHARLACV